MNCLKALLVIFPSLAHAQLVENVQAIVWSSQAGEGIGMHCQNSTSEVVSEAGPAAGLLQVMQPNLWSGNQDLQLWDPSRQYMLSVCTERGGLIFLLLSVRHFHPLLCSIYMPIILFGFYLILQIIISLYRTKVPYYA